MKSWFRFLGGIPFPSDLDLSFLSRFLVERHALKRARDGCVRLLDRAWKFCDGKDDICQVATKEPDTATQQNSDMSL